MGAEAGASEALKLILGVHVTISHVISLSPSLICDMEVLSQRHEVTEGHSILSILSLLQACSRVQELWVLTGEL